MKQKFHSYLSLKQNLNAKPKGCKVKQKYINKILFLCIFLISISVNYSAGEEYLAFADKMPEVVGGMQEIYKNIKYPEAAVQAGAQGKVYCLIFIDENGNVNEVKAIKGIGFGCDEAAQEAFKKVKFTPGSLKGNKVKVKLAMAIEFKLN
jgi:periplasmic protein TonB